ncbi:hypothetical protein [Butyrivibrio sp. NC3005]|uniref:hypothetical protein n=1 Tax=Butyrivibrio sp. NC3005 TaxID=1280685 RepID=UPI0003F562B4|nr:hypothetical protein [Butyrivibrio sp. NC3005]
MRNVDLSDANAKYMDGKLIIESEELAQAIQDRKVNLAEEEEDNIHIKIHIEISN